MSEDNFIYDLEQIQHSWVVCLQCQKTFLSMENAKCHFKDEHIDQIVTDTPEDVNQSDEEVDTDPDLGLAPLDDGRVICLRCTILLP